MEAEIHRHPLHASCGPLLLDSSGEQFACDACKLESSGMHAYRCGRGDFVLHGQCATCPDRLAFWGHPQHELLLVRSRADMGRELLRVRPDVQGVVMSTAPNGGVLPIGCEMCTGEIRGAHYLCSACGFFAHTLCAMLPMAERSEAHEEHELALLCSFPTMCAACRMPAVWAYRCMPCLAFYHVNCLPENKGTVYAAPPFSDRPTNPFVVPMMMGPPPAAAMFDEANPFGIVHTYGHRGV